MDRNHRDFHAHLPAAAGTLPNRPAVLRFAGGLEPANGIPVATRSHVGFLSERRVTAPCNAEPDLCWDAAIHGHTDHCHCAAVSVPCNRPVAAGRSVLIANTTIKKAGFPALHAAP